MTELKDQLSLLGRKTGYKQDYAPEVLEQQIKRLEFCRDCIDQSYKAGRDEYNRLERMIEELKEQLKSIEEVELVKTL